MWRIIGCVVVSALAGCGTSDCEIMRQVVEPSSGTEPGTLQSATLQSERLYALSPAPLAVRSDGSVMCLTCRDIVTLDAGLQEIDRIDAHDMAGVVISPDDAVYVAVRGPRRSTSPPTSELIALSSAGQPRWKATIEELWDGVPLVAGTEGPYVEAIDQPGHGTLPLKPKILGFDAATGTPRTLAIDQRLLGAAHGGVFTFETPDQRSVALHQLDPAGHVMWSHTLTTTIDSYGNGGFSIGSVWVDRFKLNGAVATPDGEVIVFGATPGPLDLGDRTLAVAHPSSFVAGFDASGATRWVFAVDTMYVTSIALSAEGLILIAGHTGGGYTQRADTYLSVATPAGVMRTLSITGPEDQQIIGMAAARDGAAWVEIENLRSDEKSPPPVMQIGDHRFTERGVYLLKLVP